MRYIIMFIITGILVLFILLYNPYLGIYDKTVTISFDEDLDGYKWEYDLLGDSLELEKEDNDSWTFKARSNGITTLDYKYVNNNDVKYEIHYKFKIKGNKIYWIEGYANGLHEFSNPS